MTVALLVVCDLAARAGAQPAILAAGEVQRDVASLVAAARELDTAWPWQPPLPEMAAVVAHGEAAAAELASNLHFSSKEQWGTDSWDLHVEQQVALALCEIFGVQPQAGRTVYSVRASDEANAAVRDYWRERTGLSP
jgi:hypothetical protein